MATDNKKPVFSPILSVIEKWIGPKWSMVIGFAAIYGVSLPDLPELATKFTDYTTDNPELLGKGVIAAVIAYLLRSARPMVQEPPKPIPTPVSPYAPIEADAPLFDESDYEIASPPKKTAKNWFTDAELDCNCQDLPGCDYPGMHPVTLKIANDLREKFGPLFVNSGYRCPAYNAATPGAAKNSYHVRGMAIDLRSSTVAPEKLYEYLVTKYPNMYGFGLYKTFIHLDSREGFYARKAGPDAEWIQYPIESADINLS